MNKTTDINCLKCGKLASVPTIETKRGNGKFCSQSCASSYNTKKYYESKKILNVVCNYCAKKFYRPPSKMKSKSGWYFCCRRHKDLAQRLGGCKEIQPDHYGNGKCSYRAIALREYDNKCMRCGYDTHSAAIIVHHRDRDRTNNTLDNLEILCCNCHAIEHWAR